MNALRIHLFGPFEVFRDGQRLTAKVWRSQQTRTVLKVLLARHGHVVPADQLLEILWPGADPTAARRRLYVRISQLRKALDPDGATACILSVEGGYSFKADAACWVDAFEFEAQAGQGRHDQEKGNLGAAIAAYEEARALYRGDFLEEDLYEDWAFAERERLRERFLTVLTELAECYVQQGRYRRAIARCHQLLGIDSCREAAYVRLMLYHYYAGEQAQALRVYERCCQVLAAELAVEPLPATATLAAQIQNGTLWSVEDAPRYPPPAYEGRLFEVPYSLGHAPFVGREREYAWLVETWRSRQASVLRIEGEAGVGKSRLADEFLGYAAAEGASVLRSRIVPGGKLAYAPIVRALRPFMQQERLTAIPPSTLAALVPLFPEMSDWALKLPSLPALPAEQERRRFFEAIKRLIKTLLPDSALLFVDDAHRAGIASCELLVHLAGTLTLVLTYRSEETPTDHPLRLAFQSLQRRGQVATLVLERLTPAAVQMLVGRLAHGELPGVTEAVVSQTAGNPLFIVALLQHMFEEGVLYVKAAGSWAETGEAALSLPPTMQETIAARLRKLTRGQRHIFDLVAVLGGEFDFVLLQHTSQEQEDRLLDTLDVLLDVGLLIEPRQQERRDFAISHDRYAEVAYETLPSVRRRQMHRRVGKAIEQVYAGDLSMYYDALAYHFHQAEDTGRECRYARLAGEQAAARFANAEAITYLRRALDLLPETGNARAERYDLALALEKVYEVQGEREAQVQILAGLQALAEALDDDKRKAMTAIRQACYAIVTSDFAAAARSAQAATELACGCQEIELEALGRYRWGGALTHLGDFQRAWQQLGTARSLAQAAGLRWVEGEIVRHLGTLCHSLHRVAECKAYFTEALTIHREVSDRRGELGALNNLALAVGRMGETARSKEYLEQALPLCRETGDRFAEGVVLFNLAAALQGQGAYEQAISCYEQSLAIRHEIGAREGEGETLTYLGDLYRYQGDYARARAYFAQAQQLFAEIKYREREARVVRGWGLLKLDWADYAGARHCFERSLPILRETGDPEQILPLVGLCSVARLQGDSEAACAYGRQARDIAQDLVNRHLEAIAWQQLGQALHETGDLIQAMHAYQQALNMRRAMGERNLAMESLAGLAKIALAQDDPDQAMEYVEEILRHLETGTLYGAEEPFRVYLTCYHVLQAHEDPRARDVLTTAHDLLGQRAATIEDEEMRRAYLEEVDVHRELAREFAARVCA